MQLRRISSLVVMTLAACSSSPMTTTNPNPLGNYTSTLSIHFNPMYSGYDGVHTYQIPATVDTNGLPSSTTINWSASDPNMVDLAPDPNGIDVMITTKMAGTVSIIATTDTGIGQVPLNIAAYTPDQWATGQTRYTSGTPTSLRQQVHGSTDKYVACSSCHSSMMGSVAIEHTPEQTGGFTDQEIQNIFLMGQLPAADLQVPLFGGAAQFMSFHQWQVGSVDESNGLVAYLRSLAPMAQGQIDFGGFGHGGADGGAGPVGDGGHHHRVDM